MTDLMERRADTTGSIPTHPHFTLGSIAVVGLALAVLAMGVAVGAIFVTASRNSVDDDLVAERVDGYLAAVGSGAGAGLLAGSVIPELTAKAELAAAPAGEVNVAYAPAVPPPATRTGQAIVAVHFEVVEGVNTIDPATGLEYETWGYRIDGDDHVALGTPGPMIRARVGDVLRFTITNPAENANPHNVDFHAVTGPGGGAAATTVVPGETAVIEARLLYPGIFMYHCAHGDIPLHIAHGMYGGILVDPAAPLPPVERELYMVQSEYYTEGDAAGLAGTDRAAMTDEHPTRVVFNGVVGALSGDNSPTMAVGETMRIYFVNAGLNLDSNFHPIGSHWDKVYPEGALLNPPLRGSQTTLVPAGGGVVVELIAQVPQTIVLVDHALTRAVDKGAIGTIVVTGDPNPEIYEAMTGHSGDEGHDMTPPPTADGVQVSIVAGSWQQQDMDAPDELAAEESPADYSVNVLTVPAGTTVTWTNDDPGMIHTVTAADGRFDSGFLEEGASWSYTFRFPGEYDYECTPHPWMRARVVVTE